MYREPFRKMLHRDTVYFSRQDAAYTIESLVANKTRRRFSLREKVPRAYTGATLYANFKFLICNDFGEFLGIMKVKGLHGVANGALALPLAPDDRRKSENFREKVVQT